MATHAPIATLGALVDRLVDLPSATGPFLTLYLDARPGSRGRDQIDPVLRKELRARRRTLGLSQADKMSFERDAERIERWVHGSLPPSANAAAVFACSADDVFEAIALDPPLERHHFHVGRRPHVYPLLQLMDRYPRYAAVLADNQYTRIYVFGLNSRLAVRDLDGEKKHGVEGLASAETRYQRHVGEHYKHNLKEVAEVLDRIVREERLDTVILAGDDAVLPRLRDELSHAVRAKVADSMHLDVRTPEKEVLEATLEVFRRHEARTDAEKVLRAIDEYRAGGLGVLGVRETRRALELGEVDELLLSADPNALQADADEPAGEGGGERSMVTAEELATRARQTSARVTFIEDANLLKDAGGVAGLLRFRVPKPEDALPPA